MKRTRHNFVAVELIVLGLLAAPLAACGSDTSSGSDRNTSQHGSSPQRVVHIDASWANYYTSMPDLRKSADIAVTATVARQYASVRTIKVDRPGSAPIETTVPASVVIGKAGSSGSSSGGPSSGGSGDSNTDSNGYLTTDYDLTINGAPIYKKNGISIANNTVRVTQTGKSERK